jgi:Flp pilus assembly protein protease CpaA
MFPDIILLILALVALIAASITDLKIKEVPDWISFGLLISALIIRIMGALIYNNFLYFLYTIAGFSAMFIIGTLFYYTRQWGGGDTKLLMGLGVVFASRPYFTPENPLPFLSVILFNILIVGAFYGIIWSIVLIFKNWQRFRIRFKIRLKNKTVKLWEKIIMAFITLNIILLFLIKDDFIRLALITFNGLLIVYFYLWIAVRSIESLSMYKTIPTEKLREGDWVAKNIYIKKELIYKRNSGISKEDITKLINRNIKQVTIKEGIPFVPPFLIGVIISIITGKILFLI